MSNPIVKWVRLRIHPSVNFFRVSVASKAGKKVMQAFEIPFNSTYLIFDREGNEVWRSNAMPFRGNQAIQILNEMADNL